MAASALTMEKASTPSRPGKLAKILYILVVLVVAFVLYKGLYQPDNPDNNLWWMAGTGWLVLGFLVFILLFLDPDYRRFGLFLLLNLALAIVISAFIQGQLVGDARIVRTIQNSRLLMFILGGFVETVIWSIVLGVIGALLLTVVPLLIISYAASTYVLALHQVEGVNRRDAMRHVLMPVYGIHLPYMVVENGQALLTKEAGKLAVIGGPGYLIIKQGNVVALERGGKITRVVNAGVTKLKPLEGIRNIFALGPQTNSADIDHVLTKDRIPLKVSLTIKVQIEPASEADKRPESRIAPRGEALTQKLDDGLYQVYEGTVMKAALTSQATSFAKRIIDKCEEHKCQDVEETTWLKVAASLPDSELRDHVMCHRFDELFDLVDSPPGEKPEVRVNKRKIYEIEQAILKQIQLTRVNNLGVFVRSVDVGKIEFPEGAERLLLDRWGAPWKQQVGLIEAEGKAQSALQIAVSEAQGKLEATRMEAQGEFEVADLKAQTVLINARAQARKQLMEGRSKAEARAAFFQCIMDSLQIDGSSMDRELTQAILEHLAKTFAAVSDIETFVKVQGRLHQQQQGVYLDGRNGKDSNE